MNTYIHLMELAFVLLSGLLMFRVYRCYRSFYHDENLSDLMQKDTGEVFEQDESSSEFLSVSKNTFSGLRRATPSKAGIDALSKADVILTDYISAFFAETTVVDIQAFRADPVSDKTAVVATHEPSDEDSVITVVSSQSSVTAEGDDKVMSDKVVHAMLDEAKLVCVS